MVRRKRITLHGTPNRTAWQFCLPTTLFMIVNNLHSIFNLEVTWTITFGIQDYESYWLEDLIVNSALGVGSEASVEDIP